MRLSLLAVIFAVLVVSGAVASTTPGPADEAGASSPLDAAGDTAPGLARSPGRLPWDLLDCTFAIATVAVPSALLAEHLPAGFRPVGGNGAINTPAESQSVSNVGFEVDDCASGAGADGDVAGMTYAAMWVAVRPPIGLYRDGVAGYFVNWDPLVPDAPRRAMFDAAGVPARDGGVTISSPATSGAPGGELAVTFSLDGLGTFSYGGPVASDPRGQSGGTFGQWTQRSDGAARPLTYWQTDWQTTSSYAGAGTLNVDEDSWWADVLGTTTVPVRLWTGTWAYTDGFIEFP